MTGDWRDEAACAGMDVELFFPHHNDLTVEAARTCARCPVRTACLLDALETRERYGIRGGKSADQRQVMLRNNARRTLTRLRMVPA